MARLPADEAPSRWAGLDYFWQEATSGGAYVLDDFQWISTKNANFAPDSASTDKSAGEMKRACRGFKEPSPIRLTDVPALVRTIFSLFGARVD